MENIKAKNFWQAVKENFVTKEVFLENEVAANLLAARTMLFTAVVLFLSWVLNELNIFEIQHEVFTSVALWGIVELLIPAFVCLYFKGRKRWLKYLLIVEFTIVLARIDSVLSYNVVLSMMIPIVLTSRYYSESFTRQIAILTTLLFGISAYCGAQFEMSEYNLLYGAPTKAEYVRNIMLLSYLPKWMLYVLLSIVCVEITQWGRHMVQSQADISREHSRVETELEMAKRIQEGALPIVHTLEEQDIFDLSAMMEPAKEVGGDFYDFFYLDKTHLVLMIADVSGKGVPAALFMMVSKLLLDNSIATGKSPGRVLAEVNAQLCSKNLENMFVTVWLGILDLETGDLVTANAGHEYPILLRKDGSGEIVKDRHGFVLGGMENVPYRETKLHLDPGDILFVYTDGVPEATNTELAQFGMNRTLDYLKDHTNQSMESLIKGLKSDIDTFAGEEPRFDDTTMLALRILRYMEPEGMRTAVDEASIETVEDYVRSAMDASGVPVKDANRISICVDEVYSNIVRYSAATQARIICQGDTEGFVIILRDNGIPFDPTRTADPKLTGTAEERSIGGLGLFMVKKLMESVTYRFDRGENEVTMRYRYGSN